MIGIKGGLQLSGGRGELPAGLSPAAVYLHDAGIEPDLDLGPVLRAQALHQLALAEHFAQLQGHLAAQVAGQSSELEVRVLHALIPTIRCTSSVYYRRRPTGQDYQESEVVCRLQRDWVTCPR
jgi:hypothetical protein